MTVDLIEQIRQSGSDKHRIAFYIGEHPGLLSTLYSEESNRWASEKVVMLVSQYYPEIVYPYFDAITGHIDSIHEYSIRTIAYLTRVDSESKFDLMFDDYFVWLKRRNTRRARMTVLGAPTIMQAKPNLAQRVVAELLKTEDQRYGVPSWDASYWVLGAVMAVFDQMYDSVDNKANVNEFVIRRLRSRYWFLRKRAARFLQKRNIEIRSEWMLPLVCGNCGRGVVFNNSYAIDQKPVCCSCYRERFGKEQFHGRRIW